MISPYKPKMRSSDSILDSKKLKKFWGKNTFSFGLKSKVISNLPLAAMNMIPNPTKLDDTFCSVYIGLDVKVNIEQGPI